MNTLRAFDGYLSTLKNGDGKLKFNQKRVDELIEQMLQWRRGPEAGYYFQHAEQKEWFRGIAEGFLEAILENNDGNLLDVRSRILHVVRDRIAMALQRVNTRLRIRNNLASEKGPVVSEGLDDVRFRILQEDFIDFGEYLAQQFWQQAEQEGLYWGADEKSGKLVQKKNPAAAL